MIASPERPEGYNFKWKGKLGTSNVDNIPCNLRDGTLDFMRREMCRRCLVLVVSAIIQLSLSFVEISPSFAQDWEVRRQRGILKVVDLFTSTGSVMMNYAEGLVTLDRENKWVPCLAEDWRWINDRTLEFALRQGVTFHNGEKFNAESVGINWCEYKKLKSTRPMRFLNLPKTTVLETVDEYTVRFIFPEPEGLAFPKLRWFFQFAPAFFAQHRFPEGNWGYLPEAGPWGTGPFTLVAGGETFTGPGRRIILEAYRNYWDRRYPKVERLIFENSLTRNRDEATRLCGDTEGAVDIVSFIRALDTLKIVESKYAKVAKSRDSVILTVFINQRKNNSLWRDIRLRKALNYAINRAELWRFGAKGNAYNLEGFFVPPDAYGYNSNVTLYKYDAEKARSLLKEAGYPDGFEMKVITAEAFKLESQIISKMLMRIGVKVKLEVLTWPEYFRNLWLPGLEGPPEEQTWDIGIACSPDTFGHTGLSLLGWGILEESETRWCEYDPSYEGMWKSMATEVNPKGQEEKIREIVKYAHDILPNFVIYSPLSLYAVNKEVDFVPQKSIYLRLKETSVTENHWSVRGKNH